MDLIIVLKIFNQLGFNLIISIKLLINAFLFNLFLTDFSCLIIIAINAI